MRKNMEKIKKMWYLDWELLVFMALLIIVFWGLCIREAFVNPTAGIVPENTFVDAGRILEIYIRTIKNDICDLGFTIMGFGVLLFGFIRSVSTKRGGKLLLRVLPVSRKMRFFAELSEGCGLIVLYMCAAAIYYFVVAKQFGDSMLPRYEASFIGANGTEFATQFLAITASFLPLALVYGLYMYGWFLVFRALVAREGLSIVYAVMAYVVVLPLEGKYRITDVLCLDPYNFANQRYALYGVYGYFKIPMLLIETVLVLALAYYLTLKKDESKLGMFQYRWSEVLFYVMCALDVFFIGYSSNEKLLFAIVLSAVVTFLVFILLKHRTPGISH